MTLSNSEEFYSLVHDLEAAGVSVEDIASIEPDLEEIFLSVVENESADEMIEQADGGLEQRPIDQNALGRDER